MESNQNDMLLKALQDTAHVQLAKTSSIVGFILAANEHGSLEQSVAHGALWTFSDYLENLQSLFERLNGQC